MSSWHDTWLSTETTLPLPLTNTENTCLCENVHQLLMYFYQA